MRLIIILLLLSVFSLSINAQTIVKKIHADNLGNVYIINGDKISKFDIVMEGINTLEQLCRLSDEEILKIDGMPAMTYRRFKEDILSKTKRIYLSTKEYVGDRSN